MFFLGIGGQMTRRLLDNTNSEEASGSSRVMPVRLVGSMALVSYFLFRRRREFSPLPMHGTGA